MRREDLIALIQPVLEEEGYELVTCAIARTDRSQTFRFTIDREEGVMIDACSRISHGIASRLDALPMMRGRYQLEVSSAGMNRPVWTLQHFRRFQGEKVRCEVIEPDGSRKHLQGVIGPSEADGFRLLQERGPEIFLTPGQIAKANLLLDPWKKRPHQQGD